MKATEENAGNAKFIFDCCKISIQNKIIIDNYLLDSVLVNSVNSLQISSLKIHFVNTSLEEPGLYITREFHHHIVSEFLTSLVSYVDLVFHLLCFRDDCISKSNLYNDHLINQRNAKLAKKRSIGQVQSPEVTAKQESIRGTRNPSRNNKCCISPPPKSLWKSKT